MKINEFPDSLDNRNLPKLLRTESQKQASPFAMP